MFDKTTFTEDDKDIRSTRAVRIVIFAALLILAVAIIAAAVFISRQFDGLRNVPL